MSQENVELVRRGIRSVEVFWELLDEDVVWDLRDRRMLDLDGVYVGRDGVVKASRRYWGTWQDYRLDAEEVWDAGASVVVVVRERGRGRGSGAPFDQRFAQVWTFSRGRIVRWEVFPDAARALEAAGLSGARRSRRLLSREQALLSLGAGPSTLPPDYSHLAAALAVLAAVLALASYFGAEGRPSIRKLAWCAAFTAIALAAMAAVAAALDW